MQVIATERGFAGGRLQEKDAQFEIEAKDFCPSWMKKAEEASAPVPEPKAAVTNGKTKK